MGTSRTKQVSTKANGETREKLGQSARRSSPVPPGQRVERVAK